MFSTISNCGFETDSSAVCLVECHVGMGASDTGHQGVVIYWTLHNGRGGTLACELSRTPGGLVVRCLDQARNVLLSERVAAAAAGGEVAEQWKTRVLAKGDYFARPRSGVSADVKSR